LLRVLINRAGHAERVEVQASSGSRRLDEAAIKAAREALYRPYSENGEAIPVWALVPTLFELS
jgi:protein TonB